MVKKLAIISTHPIQYYAPVFQLLAKQMALKVFYTRGENETSQFDNGFKQKIVWDLPLLDDYDYTFVNNVAKNPGTHHFNGIVNPTLITEIEAYRADAILVYGWASKSHLKVIRYFSGKIPVYFRGDSTLLNQPKGFKNLLKTIFLRFVYRHIDFAFYVGHQNRAYYKKYGLKETQLIFAPHAIDNDRFSDDRMIEGNALRAKLGIAKEDILILFAGKLEAKKNPMLLLEAFMEMGEKSEDGSQKSEEKELEDGSPTSEDRVVKENTLREAQGDSTTTNKEQGATINKQRMMSEDRSQRSEAIFDKEKRKPKNEKRPHVHLLFVGNGELEESLKTKIKGLVGSGEGLEGNESEVGSQKSEEQVLIKEASYKKNPHLKSKISNLKFNNIHFIDFQNQTEMPVVYQACDLFCLPSISETWGLAVNEAMACGKAVLVSDKVGCAKDLVNDHNGGVFKSDELKDLQQMISNLTANKSNLKNMGKNSLKKILKWSFQIQADLIIEHVRR